MALSSSESTKQSQLEALKNDPMGINFDRPKYSQYAICSVRVEHARWFSQCAFVRQNKGQDFIDLVLQRAQELEREQTSNTQNNLSEDQHSNDQRVMNSEAVLTIKRMGYTEDKIRKAIDTLKSRLPRGKHKVSAHDILEVILEIESSNTRSTLSKNNELGRPDIKSTKENDEQTTTFTDKKEDELPDCITETPQNDWTPEAVENEGLKNQILCKICMEKKVSIAFLPCSHLVCCEDCAPAMRTCPFCRKFIKGTVKTFLV
uniref:Baculoviral IAP repeat-containing protein 3-like isoform X2 n=1 Tax=Crassostrea virginica TaxID=6565 RepID=A0A8B8A9C2_CRAVI|nr:baculoviral IAP repeat-containing protein 3-like isoform X2 [Crassostrea virginica]